MTRARTLLLAGALGAAAGAMVFCSFEERARDSLDGGGGNDAGERPCPGDAGPRGVAVPDAGYCIDGTEVTNADYAPFARTQTPAGITLPACAWKTSFLPDVDGGLNDPVGGVDWCDAFAFCAWAGKRLCGRIDGGVLATAAASSAFESEWTAACGRSEERAFPYGPTYDPARCTTKSDAATPAGGVATCEGGYAGIFDMSGNMQEWDDACDVVDGGGPLDLCASRGGDFNDDSAAENACAGVHAVTRWTRADHLGIRCCATR